MPDPVTPPSTPKKRAKSPARILAILALVGAAVALAAVVSGSVGDSDSASKAQYGSKHKDKKQRTKASSYVVEGGDTLTSIAHRTGIPVAEIIALNPEVDPQILIAGEKLKLK